MDPRIFQVPFGNTPQDCFLGKLLQKIQSSFFISVVNGQAR